MTEASPANVPFLASTNPAPGVVLAVNMPAWLIDPMFVLQANVTPGIRLPNESKASAVNCLFAPTAMLVAPGETVIWSRPPAVMVTAAVPITESYVAWTVPVPGVI